MNFLKPSFVFHFHNKIENETVPLPFFIFMKELKNESRKQIRSYSRASSCQVPWGFPLCNGHADTKNLLFRKQLMYFNVYIAGSYFDIWSIFIVNCDLKHTGRSSHHEVISKVISKDIHKDFNRKSWFKI